MKNIFPIWWIICVLLALAHQVLEKLLAINIVFIDNYLDPFLFMPIVLHLITLERQYLWRKKQFYLNYIEILLLLITIIFISELLFPYLDPRFIFDLFDILAYILGTCIYFFILRNRR
jgi:hypothetical protein